MKKVRVTLKAGSTGKKICLFPSAEALYVWLTALERNEQVPVEGLEELVLEPGGFIEAELQGFEYSYEENQKFRRLDLVRLGKVHQPSNSAGLLVTTHSGWVSGGLLPMKDYSDSEMDVKLIDADSSRLDMSKLFEDSDAAAAELEEDVDDTDQER